jgi:glycosyltransferase involved in cell wall biosynthesis
MLSSYDSELLMEPTMIQDSQREQPLVSIGLPVYNGANYLRTAIDTVLLQTYPNLELIVSDNASTDQTVEICAEAAARDRRVRVLRNRTNIGAAGNYNQVFQAAAGRYFKWAAHDDVLSPTFVERAVEVLERNADVVLCCSKTGRINEAGEAEGTYLSDAAWGDAAPSQRFRSLVFTRHACVAVFGLVRRDVLAQTPLIAPYVGSDRMLLAELGLHGRIYEIDEELFYRRDHPGSSVRSFPDLRKRVVWFDPSKSQLGFWVRRCRSPIPLAPQRAYQVLGDGCLLVGFTVALVDGRRQVRRTGWTN